MQQRRRGSPARRHASRSPQYFGMRRGRPRRRLPIKLALAAVLAIALAITSVVNWLSGGSSSSPQTLYSSQSSTYYRYCSDARAAGAAPIYRGQPGYRTALDADGDGVACEPYFR